MSSAVSALIVPDIHALSGANTTRFWILSTEKSIMLPDGCQVFNIIWRFHPSRLLEGILTKNSTLTGNEALLAATLLQLYQVGDGYRRALGDLTLSHRHSLYLIYQNLPNPTVREADTLFLRFVRSFNQIRAGIWAEHAHMLYPSARPWADDIPKGSK